jgi:hypothetical protein
MTLIIMGATHTGVALVAANNPVSITATGLVDNGAMGNYALQGPTGTTWSTTNAGTISGSGNADVYISTGGVTNTGSINGARYGIEASAAGATVTNSGSISGVGHYGVFFEAGGGVSNQTGGTISGPTTAVFINQPGTVTNAGVIAGRVFFEAGGGVSNQTSGTIGGVLILGAAGTVTNAGAISATTAVSLFPNFANRLVVDPGAVFSGTVNGGNKLAAAAKSTLELASGTGTGTLSGIGATYINFANLTVDSGASWVLGPANMIAAGSTVTDSGTLTNLGSINGGAGVGVTVLSGGAVTNQTTGTISSAFYAVRGTATALAVTNFGERATSDWNAVAVVREPALTSGKHG